MRSLCSIVFAVFCIVNVASAEPPSKQSIQRLLKVTNAKALSDSMYPQMMAIVKDSVLKSVPDGPKKEEAIKKIEDLLPKVEEIIKKDLSWSALEPAYMQIYAETFTQEEINGVITFYESPVGASLLKKTPIIMQKTMSIVSAKMPDIMKKVNALTEEKRD